jgi:hypothetical protein
MGYTTPIAFEFRNGEKVVVRNPLLEKPYFYNSGNEKFIRKVISIDEKQV